MDRAEVQVTMTNWAIPLIPRPTVGFSGEHDVTEFEVLTTPENGVTYYLEVKAWRKEPNNILFDKESDRLTVRLTSEMLGAAGIHKAQVVAYLTDGDDTPIKKSNIFELEVKNSINATQDVEPHYQTALEQWTQKLNEMVGLYTGGDGIEITDQLIKVVLDTTANLLSFIDGKLSLRPSVIGFNNDVRSALLTHVPSMRDIQEKLEAGANITINGNVISATPGIKLTVVETLPTEDIDTDTIYLVPTEDTETDNIYDEYIYVNNAWEKIGTTEIDLTNYFTKQEVNDLLDDKADAIIVEAKGENISLVDSASKPLKAISVMGKSSQNGTPTIDNPIPITNVADSGSLDIDINGTTHEVTTTALRGIPVSSGGNYTDENNQQWVCDTIERYKDGSGKLIKRVNTVVFDGSELWRDDQSNTMVYLRLNLAKSITNSPTSLFNFSSKIKTTASQVNGEDNAYTILSDYATTGPLYWSPTSNGQRLNANQVKTYLATNNATLLTPLETPIETPLTAEQLAELDLSTYKPTTTLSSEAGLVIEYIADTKNYIDNLINNN